jgi:hypothetical protein
MTILIVIIATSLLSTFLSFILSKNDNKEKPRHIKVAAIFQIVCVAVLAGISIWQDLDSSATQKEIQQNTRLNPAIERLGELNDSIATESNAISDNNGKIERNNSLLIDSVRTLERNVEALTKSNVDITNQIRDENTNTGELTLKFDKPIGDNDNVSVEWGNMVTGNPAKLINNSQFIVIDGHPLVTLKIQNGELLISTKIFDIYQNLLVEIDNNRWWVNPHYKAKLNYDNKGVEVIDDRDNIMFSLDILSNSEIKIEGIYWVGNGFQIFNDNGWVQSVPLDYFIKNYTKLTSHFTKLFNYTGEEKDWIHKRVTK